MIERKENLKMIISGYARIVSVFPCTKLTERFGREGKGKKNR
jgi:hypothetical protein